ncbi:hypothetical protein CEV31_3526 [Brucella thiophenivorans]|uniref:Uncharacterized protein n=1 Tax=Brucella thiophenivorans TaxID=571255 RepID=A0A256FDW4_9HYPH|nr:hypothetical protein CEV31_3526 [Brucella thiophenivorans]
MSIFRQLKGSPINSVFNKFVYFFVRISKAHFESYSTRRS